MLAEMMSRDWVRLGGSRFHVISVPCSRLHGRGQRTKKRTQFECSVINYGSQFDSMMSGRF